MSTPSITPDQQAHGGVEDPHEWIEAHGDILYRYAMARLRNAALVEDILQETLLAALKGIKGFNGQSSIRTWLIGILRRKISDHFRKLAREPLVRQNVPLDDQATGIFQRTERLKPWQTDPATLFEDNEFWEVFASCTDKLPQLLAEAFELREVEGLTTQEVCEQLEITHTNLAMRVYRARSFMRDCLDKNWFHRGGNK